ncbi:hypothetical protein HPB49_015862 [Dermacentor silvarum]|uniref:Uncharacterized protein n=1 Tax=Dermacentor silvarum TaxID=543639 RepID=A0ACB8CFZ7_DERSI|nr:hypothetical protein HPB49_015862 [Dermacentor silvarum]
MCPGAEASRYVFRPKNTRPDTCDFSGLRLDNEVARVLARLPENHLPGPLELQPYGPGLEVAGFSLKGLNKLRLYGPLFPYCINGSRLLQVDFVNDGDIVLSLPWKACSGHEGRFSVRAMFSRFTAQFRIVESSDKGVKLEPMGRIVPVTTEGLRVIVDGAGTEVCITMAFHYLWFAVSSTALSSAVARIFSGSACDFTGMDVDGTIARLIAKFPDHEFIGRENFYPVFAGFEIRGFNASGFHKLQQYGPAIPYCVNGRALVQVDFINTGDVVLTMPWRHCSGQEGAFSLRSELSRFTTQFHIGQSDIDKDIKLFYQGPTIPVAIQNIQINVDGAGTSANGVAGILGTVFPAITKELWNDQFFYTLSRALHQALN